MFTYKTILIESEAAKLAYEQLKIELEIILTTMEDEEHLACVRKKVVATKNPLLAVHPALGFTSSL